MTVASRRRRKPRKKVYPPFGMRLRSHKRCRSKQAARDGYNNKVQMPHRGGADRTKVAGASRRREKPRKSPMKAKSDPNMGENGSRIMETERSFMVWIYKVPRKNYGRLDYNAAIAQRIHSNLMDADLDEPDIIKEDYLTFRVVIPNTGEYSKLIPRKQATDIRSESLGTEEIRGRCISLLSKENTTFQFSEKADVHYLGENTVENLQNNPEVYSFLTLSFEKEIFAYAERALQYVKQQLSEKMDDKEKALSYTKLEIHSLLSRKLREHDTTANPLSDNNELKPESLQLVSGALQNKSMQGCDIKGFCNTIDGLLVLVAEPKHQADRTRISNRIEKCLQELLKEKPKIVWVEKIAIADLAARGCKLTNKETNNWGTLGCFGKDDDNSLVAITAGHFVKEGQIVQVGKNNQTETLGRCTQSQDSNDVDIAIVNIKDDMKRHCVFQFLNENNEVCKASVYQEAVIKPWPVHKIGAATQCTSGIVYCEEANVCKENGILINGNVNNSVFAKEGDSGAIVFFYDPKDERNRQVKLLSIVSKQVDVKGGAIPVGLSRKPTLTRRLKNGLDTIPHIKI